MNGNQGPLGPGAPASQGRDFTQKALDAKFSYAFKRNQIILLVAVLRQQRFPLGSFENKELGAMLEEFERTAIQSITDGDYEPLPTPPGGLGSQIPANGVKKELKLN